MTRRRCRQAHVAAPRDYFEKVRLMYDLAALAFETDSTRLVALMLDSVNSPAITIGEETMSDSYHAISHHGRKEEKLRQHEKADRMQMRALADRLVVMREGHVRGELTRAEASAEAIIRLASL